MNKLKPHPKLTRKKVQRLRELAETPHYAVRGGVTKLAAKFNVPRTSLVRILKYETWKEPCEYCGATGATVHYDTEPYDSDVNGDHTKHWICDACAEKSAAEI